MLSSRMPLLQSFRLTKLILLASMILAPPAAVAGGGLVANDQALRLGLTRAWFSQTQLDRSLQQVQSAVLYGDQLFVLTSAGTLHVMDAHTGRTVWIERMGDPKHPSLGPAVSDMHVALVSGSTLFVLNRSDGRREMTRELGGGAGGGPALTTSHVYVPLFSGKMEAYSLNDSEEPTWYYASTGRVFDAAAASADSVMWPTDRGYLYVANSAGNGVRYRFESASRITGLPAVQDGVIYAAAASGYVHAIDEQAGGQKWRYATGAPITRSPVVIGNRVYAATESPTLHCLNAKSGVPVWEARNMRQLVAVSKSSVYGINNYGDVTVIDAASGVPQGRLRTSDKTSAVINDQTDRLYLISETGLVQCLHEIDSDEPYLHGVQPAEQEGDVEPAEDPGSEMTDDEPDDGAPNLFEEPDDSNPFGEETDAADNINPFG
ncbi:MAG: PQQ-binding-like beta-propeller repeat protein [Aeoliella sp.]